MAQKSKPLPNDQKFYLIILKPVIDIKFIRQIKEWIKHFVGIRYSMHDLLSDVSNYAWPEN